MSSESAVLEAALNVMDTTLDMHSLIVAVDAALSVKAPAGDPEIIAAQADTYGRVANLCLEIQIDESRVKGPIACPPHGMGRQPKPRNGPWASLGTQAQVAKEAFAAGSKALATWADQLRTAQSQDTQGRELLAGVRTALSQLDLENLLTLHPELIPPAYKGGGDLGMPRPVGSRKPRVQRRRRRVSNAKPMARPGSRTPNPGSRCQRLDRGNAGLQRWG